MGRRYGTCYWRTLEALRPSELGRLSARGRHLLTGAIRLDPAQRKAAAGEARMWNVQTGMPLGPPMVHRGPLRGGAFSADGRVAVAGGFVVTGEAQDHWPGEARVWDTATGEWIGPALEHPEVVTSVAISPNGRIVATGCRDGYVRFWIALNGQLLAKSKREAQFNQGTVSSLCFSPTGQSLLSGNLTEAACGMLFEVPTGQALPIPLCHKGKITAAVFSPDGRSILTGSHDTTARLWDAATGRPRGAPLTHPSPVMLLAYNPDGKTFAIGCTNGAVQLWEAASLHPCGNPLKLPQYFFVMVFSPDGKKLLTDCGDTYIQEWEMPSGRPLLPWQHPFRAYGAAYSPDGRTILTGGYDGSARLWDGSNGTVLRVWKHTSSINRVAFCPDGRLIATAGQGEGAQLWKIDFDQPFGPPLLHSAAAHRVVFSPDGRSVLTGSLDKTARLWDVATGKSIGPPLIHRDGVWDVAFSPDGQIMLTASADGTAARWEVTQPVTGEVEQVRQWVEAITGLHMDAAGVVRDLQK